MQPWETSGFVQQTVLYDCLALRRRGQGCGISLDLKYCHDFVTRLCEENSTEVGRQSMR
jgi:hypothetical protein